MPQGDPFLLGVNYWPRRKAMYWWADFDAGEVREEFAMIRETGFTHVRIFLLWESFQPQADRVSAGALRDLRTVCDIAGETGLKLEPTFFTGHMSGPNWAPDWLISGRARCRGEREVVSLSRRAPPDHGIFDVYAEAFVLEAEERLLRAVCRELRDHPAVWGWSLGNEPDLFCQPVNSDVGTGWVRRMGGVIKAEDPDRPVLIGLHTASLDGDVGFRVDQIAGVTDISVMHGYSIYNLLARRALDPDYAPFTCALTSALAGRPVLYEEYGVCTQFPNALSGYRGAGLKLLGKPKQYFSSEEDAGEYYRQVLPRLVRVGALGAFAWCFGDYDESLWDRPPCDRYVHERTFGLFRADGSAKPAVRVLKEFAASAPTVSAPGRPVMLPVGAAVYYQNPRAYEPMLYDRFGRL
jgi:endo-1,4-beta-mannosidase